MMSRRVLRGHLMPFSASLSKIGETIRAAEEASSKALGELPGRPDLAVVFFSMHHAEAAARLGETVRRISGVRHLLGCSGEAIVGNDEEIESGPAVSVWLGQWKESMEPVPFHAEMEQTSDGMSLLGRPDALLSADPNRSAILMLADPYTFPVDHFLKKINEDHPGIRVVGGMASGGRGPGESRLLLDDALLESGAAGLLVQGVAVRSVVSQGCKPIGRHMVITRADDNIIQELGGQTPLARLQQLWTELSPGDQQLFQRGLHLGVVINEYQGEFKRGDFLIRNVIGLERESGALAITDHVRIGQTVQFHVRDADTADEDVRSLLETDRRSQSRRPAGALLFTCNGRGTRLFSQPHHDARVIRSEVGPVPLAGFFAQGELGPVGGKNFIHGFTASIVIFEE
jgi:small ligand-binding sensory domain FIST